jgi:hypothetical protein
MNPQQTADANFYAFVHHLLETEEAAPPIDQELDGLIGVRAVQYVAPYRNGKLPARDNFQLVLGTELTSDGFSYLAGHAPDGDFLVVALGNFPHVFLIAEVSQTATTPVQSRELCVVTCRFLTRLSDFEIGPLRPFNLASAPRWE